MPRRPRLVATVLGCPRDSGAVASYDQAVSCQGRDDPAPRHLAPWCAFVADARFRRVRLRGCRARPRLRGESRGRGDRFTSPSGCDLGLSVRLASPYSGQAHRKGKTAPRTRRFPAPCLANDTRPATSSSAEWREARLRTRTQGRAEVARGLAKAFAKANTPRGVGSAGLGPALGQWPPAPLMIFLVFGRPKVGVPGGPRAPMCGAR